LAASQSQLPETPAAQAIAQMLVPSTELSISSLYDSARYSVHFIAYAVLPRRGGFHD
jgi:hypothetical protein